MEDEIEKEAERIVFYWTKPTKPNGDIVRYIIRWKDGDIDKTVNLSGSSTRGEVSDLSAFTKYEFTIACESSGGEGPSSSALSVQTSATGM